MNLGTSTPSTTDLLSSIAADVAVRKDTLIREWEHIVAWAEANIVRDPDEAATITDGYLDTGVPIAGPGAPLVSEFGLMELIAVLERNPDSGKVYVGSIIECAWRLPKTYARVMAGKVEPWRAQRLAELTHSLPAEAAAFVDHQLAIAVSKVTWALIERLVREAIIRFDPERAEAERKAAADHRNFNISEVDENGLVDVTGRLDAADGRDLDEAIAREAGLLGRLGDESSMDVRRAKAAGALARRDLALDLLFADETTGEILAHAPGRKVTMSLHVTDTTLTGDNPVGRWEEGGIPVSAEQIKEWLQLPDTVITVRPVIDLAECIPVGSYEIPGRHRRRVQLRDHTCRFPNCNRKAEKCDLDHALPHGKGGVTCPCNLVPLCRKHHRAKTHSEWRYRIIKPGHYAWTSPNGHQFEVRPSGTFPIEPADPPDTDRP